MTHVFVVVHLQMKFLHAVFVVVTHHYLDNYQKNRIPYKRYCLRYTSFLSLYLDQVLYPKKISVLQAS